MRTLTFTGTDIVAPDVVLGLMRIADLDDGAIRALLETALDVGIDFVDHADIYGGELHRCERRFAEAAPPSLRDAFTIQTKCGIVPRPGGGGNLGFDFSYEHIVTSVDASLAALGTDRIDVLLLHRPDALVEPDEVARAFDDLESAGKVRAFGVSNHTPGQIELLRRSVRQSLVADQLQLSLTHAGIVTQGLAANMGAEEQSVTRDGGGVVDYCRLHGITIQAWSPFQSGFFTGPFLGSPEYPGLNAVIDRLAGEYGVPPEGIATAWITRHPARMQVVLGTTRPDRVRAAATGSDLRLTRAQWYELTAAAGALVP